jgi:hypothetical protein
LLAIAVGAPAGISPADISRVMVMTPDLMPYFFETNDETVDEASFDLETAAAESIAQHRSIQVTLIIRTPFTNKKFEEHGPCINDIGFCVK